MAQSSQAPGLLHSTIQSLPLVHRGKVRDNYLVDDDTMLIVATDRVSAFDVVMNEPVAGKGEMLTEISKFWFRQLAAHTRHHWLEQSYAPWLTEAEQQQVAGRAMLVRRYQPVMFEAVVRGYLAGSGWQEYCASGSVCGIALPPGLVLAAKLEQPIFTPTTKAAPGEHDQNVSSAEMAQAIGEALTAQIRDTAIALYQQAADHALARGIIIADSKFEFGLDADGNLVLIDEVLTPDSSRFWPLESYRPGQSPPSFDKQFIRDYLLSIPGWDKTPPPPPLPAEVIAQTQSKYRQALKRLLGEPTTANPGQ